MNSCITFKLQIMNKLVSMKLVTNRKELHKYVSFFAVSLKQFQCKGHKHNSAVTSIESKKHKQHVLFH